MPATGNTIVLRKYNIAIVTICVIGVALSYYAYVVETRKEQDDSYEPMCDVSERINCTKVLASEYAKGFGLIAKDSVLYQPNSVYGMIFYSLIAILSISNNRTYSAINVVLGIISNFSSVYLAYLLYKLDGVCIVCVSMYIVNAAMTFFAVKKMGKLSVGDTRKKKMK